jgi:hypothetical protein
MKDVLVAVVYRVSITPSAKYCAAEKLARTYSGSRTHSFRPPSDCCLGNGAVGLNVLPGPKVLFVGFSGLSGMPHIELRPSQSSTHPVSLPVCRVIPKLFTHKCTHKRSVRGYQQQPIRKSEMQSLTPRCQSLVRTVELHSADPRSVQTRSQQGYQPHEQQCWTVHRLSLVPLVGLLLLLLPPSRL